MTDKLKSKHKGSRSEMLASCWLLEHGWEVFRNVSDRGEIDLIGFDGENVVFFDVKTVSVNYSCSGNALTQKQHKLGVLPIYVTHDGICSLDISRIRAMNSHKSGGPKTEWNKIEQRDEK